VTASGGGCAPPCSRSATGRWGSGKPSARCGRDQRAALLVPQQDGERPGRAAQVGAPGRQEGPGRDLERRGQRPRPRSGEGVRRRLRRQVPQGCREGHRGPGRAAPVESTFATVRLRTKVTKGHGSKAAAMGMAFKLIESAQFRWRMVNAPHLVALVRAGATFVNGKLPERPAGDAPRAAEPGASDDSSRDPPGQQGRADRSRRRADRRLSADGCYSVERPPGNQPAGVPGRGCSAAATTRCSPAG